MSSDAELIEKAEGGDHQAFRFLVEKHQGMAYSVAFRMVGNSFDAEDVVQNAFVRLWKNLSRYRAEVKLTTWLYKIVVNCALDLLKSKHRKQQSKRVGLDGADVKSSITPESEMQKHEMMSIVLQLSEGLAPKQRAVFVLRDLEGLSVEEVCEILSLSPGNVKSNLYHARSSMSEKLKRYYGETEKRVTL